MPESEPTKSTRTGFLQFGLFEMDLRSGELHRAGRKLKLGGQPFQVLCILLEQPGQVVTREELQKRLWPDTFVDVDHNINTAINKIREVLGDSAENPRFVETLPRRGYRFIAPVTGGVVAIKPLEAQAVEPVLPPKPKFWRQHLRYNIALLCAALIIVGGAVYKSVVRSSREPRVLSFRKITDDGRRKVGRLASDGSRIYFTEVSPDTGSVMVEVSVKGGNVLPIQSPLKHASVLDISKDGATLLVGNDEGEGNSIWMLPVAGGSPRRIGDNLYDDAVFGPDPNTILVVKGQAVDSINLDGSLARKLLSLPRGAENLRWLQDSPIRYSADKKRVRFGQFDPEIVATAVMETAADGTAQHRLFPGCCGEWTPDQRYFVFQNDSDVGRSDIWTTRESKSLSGNYSHGKPIRLTSGPLDFQNPLPIRDSSEVIAIGSVFQAELSRYDARSNEFVPYLPGVSASGLAFSPDGQWVTYTSYPGNNLWRSRVDGSERVQLTFPPMGASLPNWSPDGKQIVFSGALPGKLPNIYILSSEGGVPQQIHPSHEDQADANWSPDGSSLVFALLEALDKPISILDLKTRRVTVLPDSYGLFSPHWSPNGRYIAALKAKDSHAVLYDFQTGKWTEIFSGSAGFENWSHNGDYLYFQNFGVVGTSRILRFSMKDRSVQEVANPRKSGRLTTGGFLLWGWLGLAPDDSPLIARDIGSQEIYALEMDWP